MQNPTENSLKRRWHSLSRYGLTLSRFLIAFFIFCLVASITIKAILFPFSIFVIGIEIALLGIFVFRTISYLTYQPAMDYDTSRLQITNEQVKLLLQKISYDIGKYDSSALYYFNGVRNFKYSTIVLAGASTIILGLDFGETIVPVFDVTYTIFSKNAALIIGTIITISTSLVTYWNIEKYWLTNKTIANKLKALRDEIENAHVANALDPDLVQKYFKSYADVKEVFLKYWEGALAERGPQK